MDYFESSKVIIERAIKDYNPYAIILMLSGGDDSMAALEMCKQLGIKIDFIMHGVTGTGIEETRQYVHKVVAAESSKFIESNAGDAYVNYVLRKGFMGVGIKAHSFSYHLLKWNPFKTEASKHIRQRKRNRNILFINGGRRQESANRQKTFINPIKAIGSNIWVNIINEWPNKMPTEYLEGAGIERNPVSRKICRSGECNCGTMLTQGDRIEIGYHYPKWKAWVDGLSKAVRDKGFTWDWAEQMPKGLAMERKGQLNMFQPLCQTCVINYEKKEDGATVH